MPARVLGDGRAPRDVVHGAGALAAGAAGARSYSIVPPRRARAAPRRRRRPAARRAPSPAARGCARGRRCRRARRRSPGARARPGPPDARRSAARRRPGARRARGAGPRSRRTAGRRPRRARVSMPSAARRCSQKSSAAGAPTRETIVWTMPAPGRPGVAPRVLEERQLGARAALLVGVEQVVDARVVLVDGLGGQPQAEDARVEVEVPPRVPGDRGDVVDAFELQRIWNSWVCGLENGSYRVPLVARSRTLRMSTPRPPSFVKM